VDAELPPELAVRAESVAKTFRIPQEPVHTLKERVLHPMRRRRVDELPALRDVSFEVRRGECFGIVGRNGSGKSTLMKCLSGIYRADAGEMWMRGRMAPFIELGVGFNPELTASDNVLLNAIMLGLTPAEARARFDDIIAFAELEEFVDLKLKNYSSGMQVRLAFSVMVHVDADVLLIDEVLAVGDAAFQRKCYDALAEARGRNQTILLVSHDMDQVQRFCDRALLLERGHIAAMGDSTMVARRYHELNLATPARRATVEASFADGPGNAGATVVEAWVQDGAGTRTDQLAQGAPMAACALVRFEAPVDEPVIGFSLADASGRQVFLATTEWDEEETGSYGPGEVVVAALSFDNWFSPGVYTVGVQVTAGGGEEVLANEKAAVSFSTHGERSGAGVVDVPHRFHLNRRTAATTPARQAS
jgi:ABC-type polysaccharide/polyol phosphate transport system ATPase subunit